MVWTPPVFWTVAGLGLIALEAVVPGLVILFFGLGALVTALAVLVFDLDTAAQILVFACASLVCLATLRGALKKIFLGRSRQARDQMSRLESFVGADAQVTEAIPPGGTGRVRARGSFYSATSDVPLAVGETVRIVEDPGGDHSLFKVAKP